MKNQVWILLMVLVLPFMAMSQVRTAVFAGGQLTSAKYLIEDIDQPTSYKSGFMIGAGLKVPFENRLSFFPSVYYSLKGYKVDFNKQAFPPAVNALNNNTTIHAIEIAPLLQFDFSKNPSHFFVRLGPSIDVVMSGKESFDTLNTIGARETVKRDMKFSYIDYGKISAALNGQLGYQAANGLMIFAHYAHGIGSMNNADYGPRIVHRIYGISIGWLFGGPRPGNAAKTP